MKSPCIKVCRLDAMGRYCIGCGRTMEQIRNFYLDGLKNDTYRSTSKTNKKEKKERIQKPYRVAS